MKFNDFFKKNKRKIYFIFLFLLVLIFIFRVVQAKINFDDSEKEILAKVDILNLDDYQKNSSFVYSTGEIESLKQLDIKTELSAKIKKINFKIGDQVKQGQVILELDNTTLAAQLSQAQASLNQRMAGATNEDIKIYETAVELAKVDLEKTKIDVAQLVSSYESALEMSENNINLGSATLLNTLRSVGSNLSFALVTSDNILGVDNEIANDSFEDYLGNINSAKISVAEESYNKAKDSKKIFDEEMKNISDSSSNEVINTAIEKALSALEDMQNNLFDVQELLNFSSPIDEGSLAVINNLKNTVSSVRTTINTISSALVSSSQGKNSEGNNLNSYNIAYEKALTDLENAKKTAASTIQIKETVYNQSLANLEKIKANPREVDLEVMKAVISQSASIYNKTIITAPFDGVISSMPFYVGDLVNVGQIVTGVVNKEGLQIKVYVNQDERPLITENSKVLIEDKYNGVVSKIAPSIDSVNKKIEVLIVLTDMITNLTVGQYANVKIFVQENLDAQKYILPLSAIKNFKDRKVIFYLDENNIIQEEEVQTQNILGDSLEVVGDLDNKDKIIYSVQGLNVGQKVDIK